MAVHGKRTQKSLRPLNKIHVPVHEIAMMMSIALRFIPILLEETDKIMKAQIARGADFENGNTQSERLWVRFCFLQITGDSNNVYIEYFAVQRQGRIEKSVH